MKCVFTFQSIPRRRLAKIYEIAALLALFIASRLKADSNLPLLNNFPGWLNDSGGSFAVPDTMGAVGPNHLMVTINGLIIIQNRRGQTLSSVSAYDFWTGLGVAGAFDPRIYYDPYANRWILSSGVNQYSSSSAILLAVSASADPTGPWYRYLVDADPTDTAWADFPKLGFNSRWIVVQANMEPLAGSAMTEANRSHLFVFNKTNLYAGGSAQFTYISVPEDTFQAYDIVPSATYDPNFQNMFLLALRPDTRGSWTDYPPLIRIYELTGALGAEVLLFRTNAIAPVTWPPGRGAAAGQQPGTPQTIRLLEKSLDNVIYRNGTLWTVHNMFPSDTSDRTAIQWWQIATNGQVLQFGRLDDAAGSNRYAFPSIAVNKSNDVFIGYSRFSPAAFISANYTFHGAGDAPNSLRGDHLLKAGEAPFTIGPTNIADVLRWGDYSQTVVDPINDSDFWTIQEYAATQAGSPDASYGLWWGRFVPPDAWPVFLSGRRNNSDLRLTFSTSLGNKYTLEVATNLPGGLWQTLQTNLAGTGATIQSTVTNAFATPQSYFRLRITP